MIFVEQKAELTRPYFLSELQN